MSGRPVQTAAQQRRDALYRALRDAAARGLPCPSNAELVAATGIGSRCRVSALLREMVDAEKLAIEINGRSRDVVFPDGLRTNARESWVALVKAAAKAFKVDARKIIGPDRHRCFTWARYAAVWAIKTKFPDVSMTEIGKLLGGRDHSTIISAMRRAEDLRLRLNWYREKTDALLIEPRPRVEGPVAWPVRQRVRKVAAFVPAPQPSWCSQCEARVYPDRAARCRSPFCALRERCAA